MLAKLVVPALTVRIGGIAVSIRPVEIELSRHPETGGVQLVVRAPREIPVPIAPACVD